MTSETLPTLDQVIAWIESRDEKRALRFEPIVYRGNRYVTEAVIRIIRDCNACSFDTAKMIASTSWGKFQLMGFNLYSAPSNYKGFIADYFNNEILQNKTFYYFVETKGIDYLVSSLASNQNYREHFALNYNGSIAYAKNIEASLQHFGVSTV